MADDGETLPSEEVIDQAKLKSKRRKLSTAHKDDLYEALELYQDRSAITEKDVRDAYKKLVILYHPDKYDQPEHYTEAAKHFERTANSPRASAWMASAA